MLHTKDIIVTIIEYLLRIPGVIFVFSFRGFFQSYVATKLGDPTPREMGRLTLNPAAHIDPIGFLFMVIFSFGWTKPIPVRTRFFKKLKRDCAIYYASGPFSCVLGGFLLSFVTAAASLLPDNDIKLYIIIMLSSASLLSVVLGFFHLLPLPGLDGYNFLVNFLPYKYYRHLYNIEKYSMYIFIGFILLMQTTGIGYWFIIYPSENLLSVFYSLWSLIF